ncbi:MAG: ribulose-phosphate 3-epimerase [Clostridia bacterium]|nr:ribulose-phosphate 3-epimerase [Clostridia bacterium]
MPKLIRVSPSIIAIDYKNDEVLDKALVNIEKAGANFVHLDVMDGVFVKNKTFDYTLVDKIRDKTNLMLDVHLMVENPDEVIDKYIDAGADILTIHYEATKNLTQTLKKIKESNVVTGIAINPKTPALKIKDILEQKLVDIVLVMGVKPGACGQEFIPGMAEKIAEIRDLDKHVLIEIDGGVTVKNSKILRKMGANIIVSGKTVFESKNMRKTIKQLKGKDILGNISKFFKN